MAATPADSPSMLSSMLNELTSPTIQSTLSVPVSQGMSRNRLIRQPRQTSTTATAVCTPSRSRQSSPRRSSARPSSISTVPPASSTQSLPDWCSRPGDVRRDERRQANRRRPTRSRRSALPPPTAAAPRPIPTTRSVPPAAAARCPARWPVRRWWAWASSWIFRWPGRSTSPQRGPQRRTANAAAQQTIMLGIVQPRISQNMEESPKGMKDE